MTINEAMIALRAATKGPVNVEVNIWDHRRGVGNEIECTVTAMHADGGGETTYSPSLEEAVRKAIIKMNPTPKSGDVAVLQSEIDAIER